MSVLSTHLRNVRLQGSEQWMGAEEVKAAHVNSFVEKKERRWEEGKKRFQKNFVFFFFLRRGWF